MNNSDVYLLSGSATIWMLRNHQGYTFLILVCAIYNRESKTVTVIIRA